VRRHCERETSPAYIKAYHFGRYIGEPFSKAYGKWAPSQGIQPEFVTLKSGCKAFWMGDHQTAKYIMVYYHGTAKRRNAADIWR
jgi:hypothetical protein